MNTKKLFNPLFIAVAMILSLASCETSKNVDVTQGKLIEINQVACTPTSVTVEWGELAESANHYTLSVYTDEACENLYQTYEVSTLEAGNARFRIPYLEQTTPYYVVVSDALSNASNPLLVAVEEAERFVPRSILINNFDYLMWGYDYMGQANGVMLDESISLSRYTPDNLFDAREDSRPTTRKTDEGGALFACNKTLINMMGLNGWSGSQAYIRPGCVKIGSAFAMGYISSPKFATIEEENGVEATLSFSLCQYAVGGSNQSCEVEVKICDDNGSALFTQKLQLPAASDTPAWQNFSYNLNGLKSSHHIEFSVPARAQVLIDNIRIVSKLNIPAGYVYGNVYDYDGNPIEGVAMSDGFSVVATNKEGFYMFKPHKDAWYIYYSVPADCRVLTNGMGQPSFFRRVKSNQLEYNFTLRKLPNGKESQFALFTFADPQVSSDATLKRLNSEAIPATQTHAASMGIPCYGITLGDIISTSDTKDASGFFQSMREAFAKANVGMPVFQVMGNHDCVQFTAEKPLEPDETSSTFELKAQRAFENTFGPVNFSFNRGDVHIIGMRNIVYQTNTSTAAYACGFLDEQYEWLKQDLALVPKDKMVVLCVHIPMYGIATSSTYHVKDVHNLLNEYAEAHIISGHAHVHRNHEHTKYKIYEHNTAAYCGTWWASNICGCGTPNGYSVFIGESNTFSNWYYMGYPEGMNTRSHQMRLYRGDAITGAPAVNKKKGTGYYAFNFGENVILANVYNADSKWTIEVYEDGVYSGKMTKVTQKGVALKNLVGTYTMEDPRRLDDDTESAYDMWVAGYHMGVLARYDKNGSWSGCHHMYKYTLKNQDAEVKVVAIDRFGNRYEESKFTEGTDYSLAEKP